MIVGYPLVIETLTRGRTLGKLAMGLRTVRDDGGPIRFRQALVRALLEVVEVWALFGSPALISSLASARGKRLGDHLAGTYVVRERGAAAPLAAADDAVAPGRLGPGQPTSAGSRTRSPSRSASSSAGRRRMHLEARQRDGPRAGRRGRRRTSRPPPPPQTHPEDYLAAVLAERRRRDELRLARDAALLARLTGRLATTGATEH